MGKMYRLRYRVEPFAALFWALGIALAITWPCPPAQRHSTQRTQSMSLYGNSWLNSQQRRVTPPSFPMLFINSMPCIFLKISNAINCGLIILILGRDAVARWWNMEGCSSLYHSLVDISLWFECTQWHSCLSLLSFFQSLYLYPSSVLFFVNEG